MFGLRKYLKSLFYKHFWSKVELYTPPPIFDGLISIKDYGYLVDCGLSYFSERGMKVLKIRNGAFIIEGDNRLQYHYQLDKLVVMLKNVPREEWYERVFFHFESIKFNTKAYLYLFKDIDYSMQFLRLYSNFDPTMTAEQKKELIHVPRHNFDDYLVLFFDEHFRFIRYDEIDEWEISVENLLQIAKENTLAEMHYNEDDYFEEERERFVTTKPIYYSKEDWLNLSVVPVCEAKV